MEGGIINQEDAVVTNLVEELMILLIKVLSRRKKFNLEEEVGTCQEEEGISKEEEEVTCINNKIRKEKEKISNPDLVKSLIREEGIFIIKEEEEIFKREVEVISNIEIDKIMNLCRGEICLNIKGFNLAEKINKIPNL